MTAARGAGRAALAVGLAVFAFANANVRVIGSGDSRAAELTALSLLERGTFVLEAAPENDPFTRPVAGGGWISIYPPATPLLALPVFAAVSAAIDLDETGRPFAGKLAATLFAALSAAVMTLAYARRTTAARAAACGLVFGAGTNVFATSQTLWQHSVTVLFVALGARVVASGIDGSPLRTHAALGGLCLALAAAARPAAIPMCAMLVAGFVGAGPTTAEALRRLRGVVLGALLPLVAMAAYNARFFGAPWRFGAEGVSSRFFAEFPESLAGLLVSPARGVLLFTPVVMVGLLGLRDLAPRLRSVLLRGTAAHLLFVSLWNEWHGGESFGPRLLTDALPLALWALPEGLARAPRFFAVAAVWSIAVQAAGGWMYDYRWERLQQRGRDFDAALWSWRDSPLVFHAREGVISQGVPALRDARLRIPVVRFTPFRAGGSRIEAGASTVRVTGAPVVGHVRLERGARVQDGAIALAHPQDALAFRVSAGTGIVLSVEATGEGFLAVVCPTGTVEAPLGPVGAAPFVFRCLVRPGDDVALRSTTGRALVRSVTVGS